MKIDKPMGMLFVGFLHLGNSHGNKGKRELNSGK
jgi:hypothetical protein